MPRKPKPILDRIDALSEFDWTSGCLLFKGKTNDKGYGYIRDGKRMRRVHRVVYEEVCKVILLPKEEVCHTCDTPACRLPAHLFRCTSQQNAIDRQRKGRGAQTKLTEADVLEMRRLYFYSSTKLTDLAQRYSVDRKTARDAVRGVNWSWLGAEPVAKAA